MGQYYKIVNTTKKQYLHPHVFGHGLKLMEFASDGSPIFTALAILMSNGNGRGGGDFRIDEESEYAEMVGSWANDRIVVAGDYGDSNLFLLKGEINKWHKAKQKEDPEWYEKYGGDGPCLYSVAGKRYEDVSSKVIRMLCEDSWLKEDLLLRRCWGQPDDCPKHSVAGVAFWEAGIDIEEPPQPEPYFRLKENVEAQVTSIQSSLAGLAEVVHPDKLLLLQTGVGELLKAVDALAGTELVAMRPDMVIRTGG